MRRGLYRTAWMALLCLLVLAFSVPSLADAPGMADAQPSSPALATGSVDCSTMNRNIPDFASGSWLDGAFASGGCEPTPTTVLIAGKRPVAGASSVSAATRRGDTIVLGKSNRLQAAELRND